MVNLFNYFRLKCLIKSQTDQNLHFLHSVFHHHHHLHQHHHPNHHHQHHHHHHHHHQTGVPIPNALGKGYLTGLLYPEELGELTAQRSFIVFGNASAQVLALMELEIGLCAFVRVFIFIRYFMLCLINF